MFHSEYGQDKWLDEHIFHGKCYGTFVEAGALDGLLHSNSLYFEREFGWTGLLIEAEPNAFADLAKNRPAAHCIHAALYDVTGETLAFEAIDGGLRGWSGVIESMEQQHIRRIHDRIVRGARREIEVNTITLADALKVAGLTEIDYLSLDVEGAEYKVLSCFPFDTHRITVIGVEDNFGNPKLHTLLGMKGYEQIARVGVDNIYLLKAP